MPTNRKLSWKCMQ